MSSLEKVGAGPAAIVVAWVLATVGAILLAARAGTSVAGAILAPLWVAAGLGLLAYGPGRRALAGAAAVILVAGLARGYLLLASAGTIPERPVVGAVAEVTVPVAVVLVAYDIVTERGSDAGGE